MVVLVQKIIRAATKDDAEMLSAIHRECFPNYWNVDAFNDFFAVEGTYALLTEMPEPVGMIVYRAHGDDVDIMTMAVKPAFQRQGIARELLQKALDHCQSLGAGHLFLDVEDGNLPAISLYEKHGFTEVRRRKNYYRKKDGTCTDALVMSKKFT